MIGMYREFCSYTEWPQTRVLFALLILLLFMTCPRLFPGNYHQLLLKSLASSCHDLRLVWGFFSEKKKITQSKLLELYLKSSEYLTEGPVTQMLSVAFLLGGGKEGGTVGHLESLYGERMSI
jgi:hypothetical protein